MSARLAAALAAMTLTRVASAQGVDDDPYTVAERRTAVQPSTPAVVTAVPLIALDVSAGVRLSHRALRWSDDLFGEQRPYTLPLAPWLTVDAQWFPGAHFTSGWLAHLGVYASVGVAVGVTSEDSMGRAYDTSAFDVRAGLRGRLPLGRHALFAGLGYELRRFSLAPPADPDDPGVPGVSYGSATIDLDARVGLASSVALLTGVSGALPLGFGDLGERLFPATSGGAVELRAGLAWAFLSRYEVRAVASYRRYFLAMNPSPGDRWVAGGLVDEFASVSLSVALRR